MTTDEITIHVDGEELTAILDDPVEEDLDEEFVV